MLLPESDWEYLPRLNELQELLEEEQKKLKEKELERINAVIKVCQIKRTRKRKRKRKRKRIIKNDKEL